MMSLSNSSLIARYQALLANGEISPDESQLPALNALDSLLQDLHNPRRGLSFSRYRHSPVKGLYLWGKVGRGKTFLLDLFVACLRPEQCLRLHFHHFMASVHQQLQQLTGQKDPLRHIARELSRHYQVLCFDEFFVADIGDAMLLGTLMQCLFEFNVTLVATSNTAPEDLYKDGLQRSRFLPAIKAIQTHTSTLHLSGVQDHRERNFQRSPIYFPYADAAQAKALQKELLSRFQLPAENQISARHISILGRKIPVLSQSDKVICFEFAALCEGPRSHLDYIEIGSRFHTVIVLHIPCLSSHSAEQIKARGTEDGSEGSGVTGERQVVLGRLDNATRRFIALVDELYDRKVNLLLTSEVPLTRLYTEGSLTFEFERTRSRLLEMASTDYQQTTPH